MIAVEEALQFFHGIRFDGLLRKVRTLFSLPCVFFFSS